MPASQALLDYIRVLNKYVTNKIMIHICGKDFGHFAILSHEGRKSGKLYRTPIIAEPFNHSFVIALTYGKKVDWLKNVMTKGGCTIFWKKKDYVLVNPEFIDTEIGMMAFPTRLQSMLRRAGIQYFLKLDIQTESQ